VGVSKDCSIYWVPPIISGTAIYELQILYAYSQDRLEEKPIKNLWKTIQQKANRKL